MQRHTLAFHNPLYHAGLNITVRKGDEWMRKANVGDRLNIKQSGHIKTLTTATLVGKAYIPFIHIPDNWLHHEHDPYCQTYTDLLVKLRTIYNNFSEGDLVTVLLFAI